MNLDQVRIDTLHRACAGFAISVAMLSCALDTDEAGPEADSVEDFSSNEGLDLWTGVRVPPYRHAALGISRRTVELKAERRGDVTVSAALRWRDEAAGAVDPRVGFGLVTARGETSLLEVFESGGLLRMRVDLEMTDMLEIGVWYRVVLTIADSPDHPVQIRVFDEDAVEVWRSCGEGSARCPSAPIAAGEFESLRINVTVDDARGREGMVELGHISLKQNP